MTYGKTLRSVDRTIHNKIWGVKGIESYKIGLG